MSTALLLERTLDHDAQARVRQAAQQAGLTQSDGAQRPAVVVAGLAAGSRSIPSEVMTAAEPGLPLILLCHDPLVQPTVLLAGGRLVLVPAQCAVHDLAEHLRSATRAAARAPRPVASTRERRWSATRIGDAVIVPAGGALIAIVADDGAGELARDAVSIAGGFSDPAATARLLPPILARGGSWASAAVLDAGSGPWCLAWQGAAPLVASGLRLPAAWRPAAGTAGRVLGAERGDVVLLAGPLPDDAAFADAVLGDRALGGGAALAAHLVEHADRLEAPLAALIVEVLP